MNAAERIADSWLRWIVAASWQLALLVAAVAALAWLLRGASPRLRYGLWLLVPLKALLPPSLAAAWGVGAWALPHVAELSPRLAAPVFDLPLQAGGLAEAPDATASPAAAAADGVSTPVALLAVWAAGCVILWGVVLWRYWQLRRAAGGMRAVDEGPVRVELERLAQSLALSTTPQLYATADNVSPMLFGVRHPRIVLPEAVLERLDANELEMILAHELIHWRRRDTWAGWLQVVVQGAFWFHPLVWLANARIRHERECACDEAVLRLARCTSDRYGETILRVLTAVRGRGAATASMVGVFERGSRLQTRLEEIMSFDPAKRTFGWLSRAVLVLAALVLLPMAAPAVQTGAADESAAAEPDVESSDDGEAGAAASTDAPADARQNPGPTIVATTPEIGATDVDPALTEITLTFDRDMDAGGFSWTGGPAFPPTPEGAAPSWKDARTCALPVELKRGTFYRVGVNSPSHRNFRGADGAPAETAAIYFATRGASRSVASRVRAPRIEKISPENGADDVDPRLSLISVTFDVPMDTGSFSWTGGGPTFPKTPAGQKPRWSRNGKTCTLPVELAPGTRYELGLNSFSHKNFATRWGVPLEPVRIEFTTAGDAADGDATAGEPATDEPAEPGASPQIVTMTPENSDEDVDPGLTEIQVTFDRPMAEGFSWTGGGPEFPPVPAGQKPRWSDDRKTCTLPVALEPNRKYRLGLNSRRFQNFASADGTPLEPVVCEFQTGPGEN